MLEPFGIYVHTPWCKTRCPYCAFNVFLSESADYERWAEHIKDTWIQESSNFQGLAHSLYFGGGTPSLAPPSVIEAVVSTMPLEDDAEITLETNPGTIDAAGLRMMVGAGVNRLSLGIQTFNEAHAKRLGRGHTTKQARTLLKDASNLGFKSWSMDLMFALPGQTEDELKDDVEQLLAFSPPHVSLYGLSIEPNTPFQKAKQRGQLIETDDDTWARMYSHIVDTFTAAGLERYEVSNFARPGHRAVHNEAVWRGGFYAGLGPGAHGFRPSGERTQGASQLEAWFEDSNHEVHLPSDSESAIDFILSTVRHVNGLSLVQLNQRTGFELNESQLSRLCDNRQIHRDKDSIRLQRDAFPLADGVVRALINALEPSSSP
jgi:putative oxygen-independent coproporphyrinogen III oxidase